MASYDLTWKFCHHLGLNPDPKAANVMKHLMVFFRKLLKLLAEGANQHMSLELRLPLLYYVIFTVVMYIPNTNQPSSSLRHLLAPFWRNPSMLNQVRVLTGHVG